MSKIINNGEVMPQSMLFKEAEIFRKEEKLPPAKDAWPYVLYAYWPRGSYWRVHAKTQDWWFPSPLHAYQRCGDNFPRA